MAIAVEPYGPSIHAAIAQGDLRKMKDLVPVTEAAIQQSGNLAASLELLKVEIAKLEYARKKK